MHDKIPQSQDETDAPPNRGVLASNGSNMPSRDLEAEMLLTDLVRIDSSDPGAYETEIAAYVKSWLSPRIQRAMGAHDTPLASLQELEALPNRKCLRATILSDEDDPSSPRPADLTLLCHMDTVQLGKGWSNDTPPLGAVIRDGKLWGRGSCDMKGGLTCALLAFSDALEATRQSGRRPQHSLSLVCTSDEEDVMRGVEAAIKAGWFNAKGWVLDNEPTDGLIRNAHKGRTWFELTMQGLTAHASTPWKGSDAIAAMAEAICCIRRDFVQSSDRKKPSDAVAGDLGPSTVTFGQIQGGYSPYVVPDTCKVWIDMRLAPPATTAWARRLVEKAIGVAESAIPGSKGSYVVTGDRPAIPTNPSSPLLSALRAVTKDVTGKPAGIAVFTGYTDSAVIAGVCGNKNCMSYGPGSLEVAHKPNEYVPLRDLARVRAVLSQLALETTK